jgi:hypothetical protein
MAAHVVTFSSIIVATLRSCQNDDFARAGSCSISSFIDSSNLVGSLYVQVFLCATDGVNQRSFGRWHSMTDSFKLTRGRRCEGQLSVWGSERATPGLSVQMPRKRRSEDVDSERLNKGQKRFLVRRKRGMKM